jgi:hypothetical protein
MKTVGILATIMAAAGVVATTAVFVKSLPDIAHYLRLRKM